MYRIIPNLLLMKSNAKTVRKCVWYCGSGCGYDLKKLFYKKYCFIKNIFS